MKTIGLIFLLILARVAPGLAQSASELVVGSVRDQLGAPVDRAAVALLGANGRIISRGETDQDGTFALSGSDGAHVRITCEFCRAQTVAVRAGEPVVAIVHRYRAVSGSISEQDIAALPYGHAESALSLIPFTVLRDSRRMLPGASVSDRGLSRTGGLLIEDGVADYDIASNASPYASLPIGSVTTASFADVSKANAYGDRADAGTASVATLSPDARFFAGGGADGFTAVRGGQDQTRTSLSLSENSSESRSRGGAEFSARIPDGEVDAGAFASRALLQTNIADGMASSFGGAHIDVQQTRAQSRYAQLNFDRGSYAGAFSGWAFSGDWSDVDLRAGIRSAAPSGAFLEAALRDSNGTYDATSIGVPFLAGSITQTQVRAGYHFENQSTSVTTSLATFDIGFRSGPQDSEYASSAKSTGTVVTTPEFDGSIALSRMWSVRALAAKTFRLPTLLERYRNPPVDNELFLDRNAVFETTVTYTDGSRLRASFTAYRQTTDGPDQSILGGAGASVQWQVSDHLALRAWQLRTNGTTVGSLWATFERGGVRFDGIYRRDLLDKGGHNHVDGSANLPLGPNMQLFVHSEERHLLRYTDVGIQQHF